MNGYAEMLEDLYDRATGLSGWEKEFVNSLHDDWNRVYFTSKQESKIAEIWHEKF
jgi:hypothetical protein